MSDMTAMVVEGVQYDIKDATARNSITTLENGKQAKLYLVLDTNNRICVETDS